MRWNTVSNVNEPTTLIMEYHLKNEKVSLEITCVFSILKKTPKAITFLGNMHFWRGKMSHRPPDSLRLIWKSY